MRTSAPGSSRAGRRGRGFTLIELLLVVAIIAVSAGLIVLALRDGDEARLEEEGARLGALLEMARAEARVAGVTVRWIPKREGSAEPDPAVQFRFVGLPLPRRGTGDTPLPTRWIDPGTRAQVVGASNLLLGPEAILPPQRVVLTLGDKRLELASDGLGPFAVVTAPSPP